jgi:hypothetical protein
MSCHQTNNNLCKIKCELQNKLDLNNKTPVKCLKVGDKMCRRLNGERLTPHSNARPYVLSVRLLANWQTYIGNGLLEKDKL